jgi:hypothetical protein
MNKKLLKMTVFLTIFTIITHIIQFGAQLVIILFNSDNTLIFAWAFFILSFMVIFKHFFTIFFYYLLNSKFKTYLDYFYS